MNGVLRLFGGIFLGDVSLPIGNDERGKRQSYDEADEAQQCSPDRERKQQNGGIEPHGLTHDTRRYHQVGN